MKEVQESFSEIDRKTENRKMPEDDCAEMNGDAVGRWRIRKMEKSDWSKLLATISDEGWRARERCNISEGDANADFVTEEDWSNEFYSAEDVETDQLLGYISISKHGDRHAYIGGYYVRSDCAKTKLGLSLLQIALDRVKGRNVMADFQLADFASAKYETEILSQFRKAAWRVLRYVGSPTWEHLPPMTNQQLYVCHAQMIRAEDISRFDRSISGQNRLAWLRRFLRHSHENWLPKSVQLVVTDRRGEIRGYGGVRPGLSRARIGPIYARDLKTFLLLFRNLMGSSREAREKGVDVCVSSSNRQAIDVMESVLTLRRSECDESNRFYTEWHPHAVLDQAYCLTNCNTQFI